MINDSSYEYSQINAWLAQQRRKAAAQDYYTDEPSVFDPEGKMKSVYHTRKKDEEGS